MPKLSQWMLAPLCVFGLVACTSTVTHHTGDTTSLQGLQDLSAPPPAVKENSGKVTAMREDALKEVAMSLGAQAGLHWRSDEINAKLMAKSKTLDETYQFERLLLPHNVLPPVLTEARQTLNLDGPNTIRLADVTYEIESQAKFVTTVPTWRDYLWMDYPVPPKPDSGILPHNSKEVDLWRKFAEDGWNNGVDQANQIYSDNLSRLERDYTGMALYRTLRAQNIVSAPFVSRAELGVTGGGESMNVNDQVLRITALPALEPNSTRWQPALETDPQ
ncbi:MAG TPA: type IV secretion system DotC family protein [Gammaproteobacteria bacterium]|nr:type IV secretion system DotC family protein [Gammaproteobacteria bacterium]